MSNQVAKFEKVPKPEYVFTRNGVGVDMVIEENANKFSDEYDKLILPKRATIGSAGYDFVAPFDVIIGPRPIRIPTGIKAYIEPGWFLMLCPRSGLGMKYGMHFLNTPPIIDEDYAYADNFGHIMVTVASDREFSLRAGDRFMQGIFLPYGITKDDDATGDRHGGFGSTGK